LKKQKQDYEKCLESVTHLTHQLDAAMVVSANDIVLYSRFVLRCLLRQKC